MNTLKSILFFILFVWFLGLGFSIVWGAVFGGRNGGSDGARWWIRTSSGLGRRLAVEISEGVGRSFINIVAGLHNFFYARFPQGTMIFYGVIVLIFILGLIFK